MGADARWVCHTCKTVCARGSRPLVKYDAVVTPLNIPLIKGYIQQVDLYMELGDLRDQFISFLDDLSKWLKRHNNHKIHIGSDYSTDTMDLDDYRNETVNGKVDRKTRSEMQLQTVDEIEAESVKAIKKVIEEYAANPGEISSEKVAKDLYYKFSMREM